MTCGFALSASSSAALRSFRSNLKRVIQWVRWTMFSLPPTFFNDVFSEFCKFTHRFSLSGGIHLPSVEYEWSGTSFPLRLLLSCMRS